MKSYDLANEILLLWQANVNKSSGLINKDSLDISIVYEDYVERFYEINSVRFDMIKDKPVIVLSEKFENE
jgi:hypothetical protein